MKGLFDFTTGQWIELGIAAAIVVGFILTWLTTFFGG